MRFIGRRDRVSRDAARADGVGGGRDRAPTTASRCSSPSTTAAARRSSTRRARYDGRRRGGRSATLLYAPEMHDPDLVIRTSGEQRLSNYLLWQSAYSELRFRDELWPDFTREAFEAALAEYAARAAAASGAADAAGPAPPEAWSARARRAPARALGPRPRGSWSRSRRSSSRSSIVALGGPVFAVGHAACSAVDLPARAVLACSSARARSSSARLPRRSPAWSPRRCSASRAHGAAGARVLRPGRLPAAACCSRAARASRA